MKILLEGFHSYIAPIPRDAVVNNVILHEFQDGGPSIGKYFTKPKVVGVNVSNTNQLKGVKISKRASCVRKKTKQNEIHFS